MERWRQICTQMRKAYAFDEMGIADVHRQIGIMNFDGFKEILDMNNILCIIALDVEKY
jgi:hypothetical protein